MATAQTWRKRTTLKHACGPRWRPCRSPALDLLPASWRARYTSSVNMEAFILLSIQALFCRAVDHRSSSLGGWHASTENTDKVECYDPKTNKWTMCAPMKERRYRPGVAVVDGKIYVLGGEEGWDRWETLGPYLFFFPPKSFFIFHKFCYIFA